MPITRSWSTAFSHSIYVFIDGVEMNAITSYADETKREKIWEDKYKYGIVLTRLFLLFQILVLLLLNTSCKNVDHEQEALGAFGFGELFTQGKYVEAITYFDRILQQNPDNYTANNGMGLALFYEGKLDEAISYYDIAISIEPQKSDAYSNKGLAIDKQGRYEEAIILCNKALELDSSNYDALINRGHSLFMLGKNDEALQDFNSAIKLDSNRPEAYGNEGNVLYKLGDYSEAIDFYNKQLSRNPNSTDSIDIYYNLGMSYARNGEKEKAIQAFQSVLEINPDDEMAKANLKVLSK